MSLKLGPATHPQLTVRIVPLARTPRGRFKASRRIGGAYDSYICHMPTPKGSRTSHQSFGAFARTLPIDPMP